MCGPCKFSFRLFSTSGVTLVPNTRSYVGLLRVSVSGVIHCLIDGSTACFGAFIFSLVFSALLCAKISDNLCSTSTCLSPMFTNGAAGAGCFKACINSLATAVTFSVKDLYGIM